MALRNRIHRTLRSGSALLLCFSSTYLQAQPLPPADNEIVVYGIRSVLGVAPERTLNEAQISTYGIGTVGELLDEVSRETSGRREQPIYLINGKRVSGLGDIDSYPIEAIQSIDVLPPGSASSLGATVSQRVVNIVLKPRVDLTVGRVASEIAFASGRGNQDGDVSFTNIQRPRRINVTLRARRDEAILESDRNVLQVADAPADLGRFRTLRPNFNDAELHASIADELRSDFNGILSGRLSRNSSTSQLGIGASGNALEQQARNGRAALDLQVQGERGKWLLALDGTLSAERRRTRTDETIALDGAPRTADSITTRSSRATAGVNATRPLFNLPAGPVTLNLRGRLSRDRISARGDAFVQSLTEAGAGLNIPITSSSSGNLKSIGDLSVGIEVTRSRASRVGALTSSTYSFQWQPIERIQVIGSFSAGSTPPGVDLLASPLLFTPGVRYFDPLRRETIDIIQLSGGSPGLGRQRQANRQLTITHSPLRSTQLELTASYEVIRERNTVIAFPPASGLLLQAFPDRFFRKPNGTLVQVDVRPLNLKQRSEDQLRFGLQYELPPAKARTGRFHLSLSHTVVARSSAILSSAFNRVDLLGVNGLGIGGEARPRHSGDVTISYSERGFGLRLSGRYEGVSYLELLDGETSDSLRFAPYATLSARSFVEGRRLLPGVKWFEATRLTASIVNITNSYQRTRDPRGDTPLRYQAAYRDPKGRSLALELRRAF